MTHPQNEMLMDTARAAVTKTELIAIAERIRAASTPIRLRRELKTLDEATDKALAASVRAGSLVRLAHGAYIGADRWERMFPEERLLAATLAYAKRYRERGWVFSHESAAVLWGLPLYKLDSLRVHVAVSAESPSQSTRAVARHSASHGRVEIVEAAGVRFTGLERTLIDLAHAGSAETAIGAADAGIRRLFRVERDRRVPEVDRWRARQLKAMKRSWQPGVRQARQILTLADGRAESVLESVSRLQLSRLGVSHTVQVPISGIHGRPYWVDFEFDGQDIFGEVDGATKYIDPRFQAGLTPKQTVLAEKRREDEIRGLTGYRVVRWGAQDVLNARLFGDRLAAFGVAVPRLEAD